jgi:glutaredoxin
MFRSRTARTVLVAVALIAGAFATGWAQQADAPIVLFFYQEGCPDCEVMSALLDDLLSTMPDVASRSIEISEPGAVELLASLAKAYGVDASTVPVIFVNDQAIVGSGRAQEFQLRAAIGDCLTKPCQSPLAILQANAFPWTDVLWFLAFAALFVALLTWQVR